MYVRSCDSALSVQKFYYARLDIKTLYGENTHLDNKHKTYSHFDTKRK
ncbi:protein of unknown function [Pseudodesulfovibrio profundus]|uniref:Uncharacterized protein n=1 Tax=Pseudodesulfovibrio profundus TaxID=57320 RepID=A0A2C8FD62_9BACT|nr:protein of unknown function [Pseudodesulfovibrio profundus]